MQIFNSKIALYNEALKASGYTQLQYIPPQPKRRSRKRNIIWFNPPYNKTVKTNIGKIFLNLIEKHFTEENKLSKIFNKNNVKISYSCTKNITDIIKNHNKKMTTYKNVTKDPICNCRNRATCPLQGNCQITNTIYKAKVSTNNNTMHYIGATEGPFKMRNNNHNLSFNNRKYSNSTTLSTYIWQQKDKNITPTISWEILKKAPAYNNITKKCLLCLHEKVAIISHKPQKNLLNKKSEIISKCRHENKYLLSEFIPNG